PNKASDVVLSAPLAFESGNLGRFYQPTNSPLINADTNTTADQVGLFHFCTTTNQVREGSSALDLSLHFVALDTNGLAVDSDGGGVPDYLENFSGDGHTNNVGETSWQDPSDDFNHLLVPGYLRCEYRV